MPSRARLLAAVLAIAAALGAGTAPAHAATVTAVTTYESLGATFDGHAEAVAVTVTAAPGERNDLEVHGPAPANPNGPVTITDAGAPLQAGPGCQATADGVSCAFPAPQLADFLSVSAMIDAGDGDDRVTTDGLYARVDGGPGHDVLTAADRVAAVLYGGDGDDVLAGGPGPDVLDGGPGTDAVSGGDGTDTVSYATRLTAVTIRLGGTAGNGTPGEDDAIAADVEDAIGGAGDDTIVGTGGPNQLRGHDGADRLEGLGGDDTLIDTGSTATKSGRADVVLGGAGSDKLTVSTGLADGGAGDDLVGASAAATIVGGPGADRLTTDARAGAIARTDDGARDVVRCTGGPARRVTLDAHDISLGCGGAAVRRRARPGTFLILAPDGATGTARTDGRQLACADDAAGGCALRVGLWAGRTRLAHTRLHLAAGTERELNPVPLGLVLPPVAPSTLPRAVTYRISMHTRAGAVHTVEHAACRYDYNFIAPASC